MFNRPIASIVSLATAAGLAVAATDRISGSAPNEAQDLLATFIRQDDGAPGKVEPTPRIRERRSAPWDRPTRNVPAEWRQAELPAHYVAGGRAVPLRIDGRRLVAKIAGGESAAGREQIAAGVRAIGVAGASASDVGVAGYVGIDLGQDLIDSAGINAVIELLLTDAGFEYIAPVFRNPEIADGFLAMLPEINVRVSEANAARKLETVARVAPNAQIASEELAGLVGAAQLVTGERNGFRVLKLANELAMNPELAWACPTQLTTMEMHYTPNDPFWGTSNMWGWDQGSDIDTDAGLAWDLTRGRSSVVVLAMDLGSEQAHPDINQLTGRDFSSGAVNGTGNGQPVTSCDNHGTPVAGIISGRVNNGLGPAGVCPNCRTLSAKVGTTPEPAPGDPCGGAWASTGNPATALDIRIANALAWGLTQNIWITNGSFGIGESDVVTDGYADANASDVISFASAGNGSTGTVGYPARLAVVQAVGAIDSDGTQSSFSNWGTGLDFVAPGTVVGAADRLGASGYSSTDYCNFSGTSAASPFAAGCAALIWSAYPDRTDNAIVNIMYATSRDLGAAGYDTVFGWGFPNVNDAIRSVLPLNNWCVQATNITTMAYNPATYSVANASEVPEEHNETCELNNAGVNKSVWYRYIPPCNGSLGVNTNGSAYDTVLSVWRGSCTGAVQVACDDDGGTGTQSQITGLSLQAGQTYYIKVSAYGVSNPGGMLDFNFLFSPTSLNNDDCTQAFDIPFNQLTLNTCTAGATTVPCEGDEPCEASNVGTSNSVWFQFTTPSIGRFNLNTSGSGYDTVLSVWRGNCGSYFTVGDQTFCLSVPTLVACNDDANGQVLYSVINNLTVARNTTYRFKVAAWGAGPGSDATFNFQFIPCPADFNMSGAVTVQDIFDFLAAYFAGDPAADFNNFSGITVQDIFDFLAAYFGGQC